MKLIKINSIEEQLSQTYDIEVEEDHNFFCNGFLIHNCSYRNEVGVVLINLAIIGSQMNPDLLTIMTGGANDFRIYAGDRIAQLIIEKYYPFDFEEVDNLSESDRTGGFGSTGMR